MSTVAKTALVNAGLAHLGEDPIADVAAAVPSAKLAKALAQLDGPAGVELWILARHPWLDALVYDSLEPTPDLSNHRWGYVFELPATFVKLWECGATDYQVGKLEIGAAIKPVIFANSATLDVSYTVRRDFEAYGVDLALAMSYELASRLAGPIQGEGAKAIKLHDKALEMIALAETGEANQHASDTPLIYGGLAAARMAGA